MTRVNYERRVAGLVLASVVLVCVGIGIAVAAPNIFTIACAVASAIVAIFTLRNVRAIHAALKKERDHGPDRR